MQLGTRWRHGDETPARLPGDFARAIAEVTDEVSAWTLTWLEGRPIVESDTLPDGTWLRLTEIDGEPVMTRRSE